MRLPVGGEGVREGTFASRLNCRLSADSSQHPDEGICSFAGEGKKERDSQTYVMLTSIGEYPSVVFHEELKDVRRVDRVGGGEMMDDGGGGRWASPIHHAALGRPQRHDVPN